MATPAAGQSAGFERVGRLADLEDGVPEGIVTAGGERVCLVRRGDAVWAVHDVCPHRGFGLSGGECLAGADGSPVLECPWHGARFSCTTGAVLHGPATEPLPTYDVRIADGEVFIGPQRGAGSSRPSQSEAT